MSGLVSALQANLLSSLSSTFLQRTRHNSPSLASTMLDINCRANCNLLACSSEGPSASPTPYKKRIAYWPVVSRVLQYISFFILLYPSMSHMTQDFHFAYNCLIYQRIISEYFQSYNECDTHKKKKQNFGSALPKPFVYILKNFTGSRCRK